MCLPSKEDRRSHCGERRFLCSRVAISPQQKFGFFGDGWRIADMRRSFRAREWLDGVPRISTPGWYALPPLGQVERPDILGRSDKLSILFL